MPILLIINPYLLGADRRSQPFSFICCNHINNEVVLMPLKRYIILPVYIGLLASSPQVLLKSRIFLTYLLTSAAVGLGVTYYFDDRHNVKLNNILRIGLQVLGLILVYNGTMLFEASAALVACLLLARHVLFLRARRHTREQELRPVEEERFESALQSPLRSHLLRPAPHPSRSQRITPEAAAVSAGRWAPTPTLISPGISSVAATPRSRTLHPVESAPDPWSLTPTTRSERSTGPQPPRNVMDLFKSGGSGGGPKRNAAHAPPGSGPTPGPSRHGDERAALGADSDGASSGQFRDVRGAIRFGEVTPSSDTASPLVKRGLILNVDTGKTIKLYKATYNELLLKGYTPDFVQGHITPPSGRREGTPGRRSR